MSDTATPEREAAQKAGMPGTDRRGAAFCARGDSFFRHSHDESLSSAQRIDYAVDAVHMYAVSIMEKTTAGTDLEPVDVLSAAARALGLPLDVVMPVISLLVERRHGYRADLRLDHLMVFAEQFASAARADGGAALTPAP